MDLGRENSKRESSASDLLDGRKRETDMPRLIEGKRLLRAVPVLAFAFVLFITFITVAGYRWSNSTPAKPKSVLESGVFLRAPATGIPGPPRGQWISCWLELDKDHCGLVSVNGESIFEGDFLPYPVPSMGPETDLRIDSDKTSKEKAIWSGSTWVPIVYLRNGRVLVPAFDYDAGKRVIEGGRP